MWFRYLSFPNKTGYPLRVLIANTLLVLAYSLVYFKKHLILEHFSPASLEYYWSVASSLSLKTGTIKTESLELLMDKSHTKRFNYVHGL